MLGTRILVLALFLLLAGATVRSQDQSSAFAKVQAVFNARCITCHSTEDAPMGMSLEQGLSYRNIVNVPAHENPNLRRISPGDPLNSYLYRKVLRDRTQHPFVEDGMPLDADRLPEEDLKTLREWIEGFPADLWGKAPNEISSTASASLEREEAFLATQLINLPTPRVLGSRTAEFRILHRFAVMNGGGNNTLSTFFGLDNHAYTSINLSIALRSDMDLLVRRSGFNKDLELAVKYVPFRQGESLPVSLGVYTGFDWISREDVAARNRLSPNIQILVGARVHDRISVLVVPTFAFQSNHNATIVKNGQTYKDTRYTMAVGLGTQYEFHRNAALTAEYIPRLDGYRGNRTSDDTRFNTWSLGLAYKIRLHVFEVVVSNTQFLHTTQYVAGSSAIAANKPFDQGPNFHFGFNIYRQFKW